MAYLKQTKLEAPVKILILTPIILLVFGIYHGLMQVLYRAGIIKSAAVFGLDYYSGLTAHGVINAVVLTTFFAVAFGHVIVAKFLQKKLALHFVWLSTLLMIAGSVLVAACIFTGHGAVLYTFYPPLKAHPFFYLGLALFVVGSWLASYVWIPPYLEWRKENKNEKTPIPVVGIFSSFVVWQIATLPVAYEVLILLLPWSMGIVPSVDIVLARTLFWFFGHPLVYFWLLPVYTIYYSFLPRIAGGKLYSDFAARFAFLSFCVMSSPLGLHHQFADPGISVTWKGLHTVLTLFVAIPSIMTAFTLAASLEYAGRKKGGTGLFAWWKKLPYFDENKWMFPYLFCGLIIFIFGGATGIVNASFNLNKVVHNTVWIPAHFHLTVGGPVFLGILGMSLFIALKVFNKKLVSKKIALLVPYLWTLGVMTMSSGQFVASMRGEPRRTNLGLTYLNPESPLYRPDWQITAWIAAFGGVIMTLSMLCYFYAFFASLLSKKSANENEEDFLALSEAYHNEDIGFVKNFKPWLIAAVVFVLVAYIPPLWDIARSDVKGQIPFDPSSPVGLNMKK